MYQHKNRQKVSGQVFCGQMRPLFSWFLGKKKDVWFRMPKMRKTISAVIGERCKIQRCHGLGNLLICEAAEIFVKDSLAEILQLVSYVPEQLKHAVKNKVLHSVLYIINEITSWADSCGPQVCALPVFFLMFLSVLRSSSEVRRHQIQLCPKLTSLQSVAKL